MAKKKLNSLKFPNLPNDTYYLDADNVEYSADGTYKEGSTGKALQHKAEIDGYYSEMSVGDAEQLISSMYVEDAEPYNHRTTGGSADVGNREYVDAIVGGTIAWNQLLENGDFSNGTTGWTSVGGTSTVTNKVLTFTVSNNVGGIGLQKNRSFISGHKYLVIGNLDITSESTTIRMRFVLSNGAAGDEKYSSVPTGAKNVFSTVIEATDNWSKIYLITSYSGSGIAVGDTIEYSNFTCFDLTQMFGSTIADYIYSLEQANAGAGVAWFKKLFPKDYYEYNAGELISVSGLESHDCVGFNVLPLTAESKTVSGVTFTVNSDGTITTNGTATADVYYYLNEHMENYLLPNNQYYIGGCPAGGGSSTYGIEILYSRDPIWWARDIGSGALFTATQNENLRAEIFITSGTNVSGLTFKPCINLSWSGYRNGEYEPYEKHSYPLDNSLTLRGIPKLDASNNLYYDGDIYASSGEVTRKYAYVDMGSLTWYKYTSSTDFGTLFYTEGIASVVAKLVAIHSVCAKYVTYPNSYNGTIGAPNSMPDKAMRIHNGIGRVYVRDESISGTGADFKNSVSGVYLVYELATPTTETAEPYQQVQICDDFGTEEFVTDSIVPVGTETRYPANLRDKLQHLPDLADNDGYYMIGQTNKQMHLELFRIPKAPTSPDGTYVLQATVSGGTPTYTWVDPNAESEA